MISIYFEPHDIQWDLLLNERPWFYDQAYE